MLTVPTPALEGAVKVAVQTAVPVVDPWRRMHGEPENDPDTPLSEKLTLPPGVSGEPCKELSATVTVHVEDWPTTTGVEHETVVVVLRGLIVMVDAALELSA